MRRNEIEIMIKHFVKIYIFITDNTVKNNPIIKLKPIIFPFNSLYVQLWIQPWKQTASTRLQVLVR
jgi:hypothetical protein